MAIKGCVPLYLNSFAFCMYSYGVVLWEILSRKVPYKNIRTAQIIREKQEEQQDLEIEGSWPALLKQIHESKSLLS